MENKWEVKRKENRGKLEGEEGKDGKEGKQREKREIRGKRGKLDTEITTYYFLQHRSHRFLIWLQRIFKVIVFLIAQ